MIRRNKNKHYLLTFVFIAIMIIVFISIFATAGCTIKKNTSFGCCDKKYAAQNGECKYIDSNMDQYKKDLGLESGEVIQTNNCDIKKGYCNVSINKITQASPDSIEIPICSQPEITDCIQSNCNAMVCGPFKFTPSLPSSGFIAIESGSKGYSPEMLTGLMGSTCKFVPIDENLKNVFKNTRNSFVNTFRVGFGPSFESYQRGSLIYPHTDKFCGINPVGTMDRFENYLITLDSASVLNGKSIDYAEQHGLKIFNPVKYFNDPGICIDDTLIEPFNTTNYGYSVSGVQPAYTNFMNSYKFTYYNKQVGILKEGGFVSLDSLSPINLYTYSQIDRAFYAKALPFIYRGDYDIGNVKMPFECNLEAIECKSGTCATKDYSREVCIDKDTGEAVFCDCITWSDNKGDGLLGAGNAVLCMPRWWYGDFLMSDLTPLDEESSINYEKIMDTSYMAYPLTISTNIETRLAESHMNELIFRNIETKSVGYNMDELVLNRDNWNVGGLDSLFPAAIVFFGSMEGDDYKNVRENHQEEIGFSLLLKDQFENTALVKNCQMKEGIDYIVYNFTSYDQADSFGHVPYGYYNYEDIYYEDNYYKEDYRYSPNYISILSTGRCKLEKGSHEEMPKLRRYGWCEPCSYATIALQVVKTTTPSYLPGAIIPLLPPSVSSSKTQASADAYQGLDGWCDPSSYCKSLCSIGCKKWDYGSCDEYYDQSLTDPIIFGSSGTLWHPATGIKCGDAYPWPTTNPEITYLQTQLTDLLSRGVLPVLDLSDDEIWKAVQVKNIFGSKIGEYSDYNIKYLLGLNKGPIIVVIKSFDSQISDHSSIDALIKYRSEQVKYYCSKCLVAVHVSNANTENDLKTLESLFKLIPNHSSCYDFKDIPVFCNKDLVNAIDIITFNVNLKDYSDNTICTATDVPYYSYMPIVTNITQFGRDVLYLFQKPTLIQHFNATGFCGNDEKKTQSALSYMFTNQLHFAKAGITGMIITNPDYKTYSNPLQASDYSTLNIPDSCALEKASHFILEGKQAYLYQKQYTMPQDKVLCMKKNDIEKIIDPSVNLKCANGAECTLPVGATNKADYKCQQNNIPEPCKQCALDTRQLECRITQLDGSKLTNIYNITDFNDAYQQFIGSMPYGEQCCLQGSTGLNYTYIKNTITPKASAPLMYSKKGYENEDCGQMDTSMFDTLCGMPMLPQVSTNKIECKIK